MSPARAFTIGLLLTLVIGSPAPARPQEDRETGASSGRRHLLEQLERERQQRQRRESEEEDARRRAKARQRQREEWMQQRRDEAARVREEPAREP